MPDFNLYNALLQAYQAQAQTAGPYFNLSSVLQPGYGQTGLNDLQQQLFGYYVPQAGQIGYPAGPGSIPPGGGDGTYPPPSSNGVPRAGSGGGGGVNVYQPPDGTLIGLGADRPFSDPYAGQVGPGQSAGYHPGVLGLNTAALGMYGPQVTAGLLQSNPYLTDALGLQNTAAWNTAGLSQDLLNTVNQHGALTPEQQRTVDQGNLSLLGQNGMLHGNTALGAELLGRQAATDQRYQQALSNYSGMQGLAGSLAGQAASSASSGITNPMLQILGLGNLNANANPSTSIDSQMQLTNPFMQAGLQAANANFNASQAQQIAGQNQNSALLGGLLNLGGGLLAGFSDRRLKKDIKKVGESPSGIKEYEWTYATDEENKRFHGAMADDVEKLNPYAVIKDKTTGLKMVDYSRIDVPFYELNPYKMAA